MVANVVEPRPFDTMFLLRKKGSHLPGFQKVTSSCGCDPSDMSHDVSTGHYMDTSQSVDMFSVLKSCFILDLVARGVHGLEYHWQCY